MVLVFIVHLFLLLFFFKQNTAYEMRISDWSSDVCSSDLVRRRAGGRAGGLPAGLQRRRGDVGGARPLPLRCCARRDGRAFHRRGLAPRALAEIGRESCRERV